MDGTTLCEQFVRAGEAHGYEAEAEIADLPKLAVRWTRSRAWIRFTVSDFLLALSPEAARDVAETIIRRIEGAGPETGYSEEAVAEMSSEAFAEANQGLFIGRNGLTEVPKSWERYQRMAEEQGVSLPRGMRVFTAPEGWNRTHCGEHHFPALRAAVMPEEMAKSEMRYQLLWIEQAAVAVGRGLGGRAEDGPDRYVRM